VRANIGFVLEQLQSLATLVTPAPSEIVARLRQSLDALNDMDASATRIEQIVRDLRAFAPSDADDRTTVDVNEVLKIAVRRTQSDIESRATLVCNFSEALLVEASPGRLAQAFSHVLTNAAEAITIGTVEQNEIRISTTLEGTAAQIEITDSGHGILADVHARMFDPFFTTKPQGSGVGLGLFVVHSVVSALGGTIEIQPRASELGASASTEIRKGTTVRILLPALPEAPRSQKQAR
jgi:signal transduction histidine kinase